SSDLIDFAYAVHSQVGERCSGARVNGIIVPLRYPLRNGDTIDILTSPTQRPSKDWLKFVVTSRAKTRIRHFLQAEQRERSKKLGRDMLARELRGRDHSLVQAEKEGLLEKAVNQLRAGTVDDMLVLIGYNKLSAEQVGKTMYPQRGDAAELSSGLQLEAVALTRKPIKKS